MELTEDMIAEIKRTATEALNSGISNRVTGMTILLLIDELERRDAEIAALRSQLRSAQAVIKEGTRTPADVDYAEYVESYERAMGAKPDAAPVENAATEPTIRVGDKVRITKRSAYQDWYGKVVEINDKAHQPYIVLLSRFYGYEVEEYERHEIELVQD